MIIFQKSAIICILASENAEKPAKFLRPFPALAAKNLQKSWADLPRSLPLTSLIGRVSPLGEIAIREQGKLWGVLCRTGH